MKDLLLQRHFNVFQSVKVWQNCLSFLSALGRLNIIRDEPDSKALSLCHVLEIAKVCHDVHLSKRGPKMLCHLLAPQRRCVF